MFFTENNYFTGPTLTPEMVRRGEAALGVRLPATYLDLLQIRNGGVPTSRCFATNRATSWAPDHIELSAVRGIGGEWGIDADNGLGSNDMIAEWEYPAIGVVIAEMPSGGHDAVMLDYSECGPTGDPRVVYVDEDRSVTVLAKDFAEFTARLASCADFPRA